MLEMYRVGPLKIKDLGGKIALSPRSWRAVACAAHAADGCTSNPAPQHCSGYRTGLGQASRVALAQTSVKMRTRAIRQAVACGAVVLLGQSPGWQPSVPGMKLAVACRMAGSWLAPGSWLRLELKGKGEESLCETATR